LWSSKSLKSSSEQGTLFLTMRGCRLPQDKAVIGTNTASSFFHSGASWGRAGRWSNAHLGAVKCSSGYGNGCSNRRVEGVRPSFAFMVERLLPAEDPVLESVLKWTVERDAMDVRRLLEWLPEARSSRERKALLQRVRGLLTELEAALDELDNMH